MALPEWPRSVLELKLQFLELKTPLLVEVARLSFDGVFNRNSGPDAYYDFKDPGRNLGA